MSRLSTIETQLRRNKLSTHMTWQATALTSCTVFPWWFHTLHTFITVNICLTILNRKSQHITQLEMCHPVQNSHNFHMHSSQFCIYMHHWPSCSFIAGVTHCCKINQNISITMNAQKFVALHFVKQPQYKKIKVLQSKILWCIIFV